MKGMTMGDRQGSGDAIDQLGQSAAASRAGHVLATTKEPKDSYRAKVKQT